MQRQDNPKINEPCTAFFFLFLHALDSTLVHTKPKECREDIKYTLIL